MLRLSDSYGTIFCTWAAIKGLVKRNKRSTVLELDRDLKAQGLSPFYYLDSLPKLL